MKKSSLVNISMPTYLSFTVVNVLNLLSTYFDITYMFSSFKTKKNGEKEGEEYNTLHFCFQFYPCTRLKKIIKRARNS